MWFEENRGQFTKGSDFGARVGEKLFEISATKSYASTTAGRIGMQIVGAREDAQLKREEALPTRVSYFLTNDRSKWVGGAQTFSRVRYDNVYDGIDLVYHLSDQQLEYDFVVGPQRDPNAIRLSFEDAKSARLDENGDLVVSTAAGDVRHYAPRAYQEKEGSRTEVPAHFRLSGNVVTFDVAEYDRNEPLVIDPVLVFSGRIHFSYYDTVVGVDTDTTGNIYVAGRSLVPPTTGFGFANSPIGTTYVAKYDPTGNTLLWVVFVGADWDFARPKTINVDPAGNVYLVGQASTSAFPTTPGAYSEFLPVYNPGSTDEGMGFVTKIAASGSSLLYSTFLGSVAITVNDVVGDADGNAYITGHGYIPPTPGALAPPPVFESSSFVTKLNPTGTALVFSAAIAGTNRGTAIDLDAAGNIVVGGDTTSSILPTTPGAFMPTYVSNLGNSRGWVAKLNPTGTAYVFATYFHGKSIYVGAVEDLKVAPSGDIYITGKTFGTDNEIPAAAGTTGTGGTYLAVLNSTGTARPYAARLGGDGFEDVRTINLLPNGNVVVTGRILGANDYPVVQPLSSTSFGEDFFVTVLTSNLSALVFSTYLGPGDEAYNAVTPGGDIILAGNAGNAFWLRNRDLPEGKYGPAVLARISLAGSMPAFSADVHYPLGAIPLSYSSSAYIVVRGTGFQQGADLLVDDVPCSSPNISADGTSIYSVSCPSKASGTFATVKVRNPGGATVTVPQPFTFFNPPIIDTVTPSSFTTSGGTTITLAGSGFRTGATVTISGGICAITSLGPNEIQCVTPAYIYSPTSTSVEVTNPDGVTGAKGVTYTDPEPRSITSVTPNEGPASGGTVVTITGTNFKPGVRVSFGEGNSKYSIPRIFWSHEVIRDSDTQLHVTTPPNVGGIMDVTVYNPERAIAKLVGGFKYRGINDVDPNFGSVDGGAVVKITGYGFAAGDVVKFGGVNATNVTVDSATQITATTPAHAAAAVDVTVTGSHEEYKRVALYYYLENKPDITSISPATAIGGASVTITGTGFLAGAQVTFGGQAATNVNVVSPTTITCTAPAHTPGYVDVVVKNYDSQSDTLVLGFGYKGIIGVSPGSGNAGASLHIFGVGFQDGATVTVGGVAMNVTFSNGNLDGVAPAHAPGPVDVVVTNPGGETFTKVNGFKYLYPTHTVTNVSPANGPQTGGTTITITGTNFISGSTVKVGNTAATNVTFVSATQLTAVTPAGTPGSTVAVSVTLPDDQVATLNAAFTYNGSPSIASVTPASGPATGGTTVTINGSAFQSGATVTFGGVAATSVTFVNAAQLTAVTPAHALGFVDVFVTNPDTQSATKTNAFKFLRPAPTVTNFTPASGSPGASVTITGTNFEFVTGVKFNTQLTAAFTVNSLTELVVTIPAGASTGPITVITESGSGVSASNFTVIVPPPAISSFTPTSGVQGTVVTINGTNFSGASAVSFAGTAAATFTVVSDTRIDATAPVGVSTGTISVTTPSGTGTSATNFVVTTSPNVTGFTPNKGTPGTQVAITGVNFTGATLVKFNGVSAAFTLNSATSITATVPQTATNGPIQVTSPNGSGTSEALFFLPPVLTSFAPNAAAPGATITIDGNNFTGATGVTFNGTTAVFTVVSQSRITATVPAGATSGTLTVTTPYGPVSSTFAFNVLSGSAPALLATASTATSVTLTWTGDATKAYDVARIESKNDSFLTHIIARVTGTAFVDNTAVAGKTYLYNVTSVVDHQISNNDYATTIMFTGDPLVTGAAVRASHLQELRNAVNAMRVAAALTPATWTDASAIGLAVKPVHITELRSRLVEALIALGRYATFTDSTLSSGMPVRAQHFQELRTAVK
ncbi:MAG TPA: IPT/TIG domain-containing protein [Thermoanaerobaculia bacterium]|nr:IPT/TIG domain-containing protein [Thermoanaerobaculia bacterium]